MNPKIKEHLAEVKKHIYINPLEKCNLKCKICYTQKTAPILSETQILEFVERYKQFQELQTITFCGGEVFALAYFPHLINTLTNQGIFVQVITNGTIDKLDQITTPNMVNLIVSLDGLAEYHDANRGQGNFVKSTNFLKKSIPLGFHSEIFSIVTKQNLPNIDQFEHYLETLLDKKIEVTYHPRKPPAYLMHHPISNIVGETNGFDFLTKEEMLQVMQQRNVFPPKNLGCYQIAIMSTGKVYGCCEGVRPLGDITQPVADLLSKLDQRLEIWEQSNQLQKCLGCSDHKFMCGIKQYLEILNTDENSSQKTILSDSKDLHPLFIREEILHATRTFFRDLGFHEVITPTLNQALPLEPNLYAFPTQWKTTKGKQDLYLSTSPESFLKKNVSQRHWQLFRHQ